MINHLKEIIMNRYEQLEALLESYKEDFSKFYDNGNKAAGTRVRKGMLEFKNLAQDIRKEVQDIKNQ
jgi:hypothetical protein